MIQKTMSIADQWVNKGIRYPRAIATRLRIARLRLLGMQIGKQCWIRQVHVPRNPWDVAIGNEVALDDNVVLLTSGPRRERPRIVIGANTYINRFTMLDASERIELGNRCMVGPFCYITDHDHRRNEDQTISKKDLLEAPILIGDDVWIGAGAIILKGVDIGCGAVIAAGSVVTRSVAPHSKLAGVPARPLGTESGFFDKDIEQGYKAIVGPGANKKKRNR